MNHLFRELAPISDRAWDEICDEATRVLRQFLAARKTIDVVGPLGWEHSAEATGRIAALPDPPQEGVGGNIRVVQPLVELRAEFDVPLAELAALDRGAVDGDLEPVAEAARRLALAEDRAVFGGYPAAQIRGIVDASPHAPVTISDDYEEYPSWVSKAVAQLQMEGVEGPYAIALGPQCYRGVVETTQRGGYPVFEHIRNILDGPIIWAPAVNGAVVVSRRGGDFVLTLGQDISVGYRAHDAEKVSLYLEESMTFRALGPEAGIALTYATNDDTPTRGRRRSRTT
jgi:uncharacterized linocin/CFP29 family protein